MRRLVLEALDDLLQLGEPRQHQVAVREEHPVALHARLFDELGRHRRLPLPERHRVQLVGSNLRSRELREVRGGIDTGRQHEDERRARGGITVALLEVQHRRFHIFPAKRICHVGRRRLLHPVHA